MASNVGFATLSIIPSTKGFGRALRGQVTGPLGSAGRDGGTALGSSVVDRFRALVGPALAVAGAASMGAFVTGAVREAANLEQSIGAIDAVFGENAQTMHEWASSAASSVGLTRNQYNELGTILGSQLRNGGTAMDELGGKTDELIRLGGDLSAMFGGTTADAVGAVSAALRGERDTIERYGVSLTQAAVDAKAAELGFSKVGGALSQEANQAATIALIMEQTAAAHGSFARETDTLSNRMQVLNATWQDSKARIGTALLPALAGAANVLIGVLGPATDAAERGMQNLTTAVGGAWAILSTGSFPGADAFFGLEEDSAAVDVLFRIREGLIGVREILANGNFVGADSFLGLEEDSPIVDFLFTLRESILGIGDAVGSGLGPLGAALLNLGGSALGFLSAFSPVGIIFQALAPMLPQIAALVTQLATALAGALSGALTALTPALNVIVAALSGVLAAVLPVVISLVQSLAGIFIQLLPPIVAIVAGFAPLVAILVAQLAPIFVQLVSTVIPPVLAILQTLVAFIMPLVSALAELLIPIIQALLPVVTTVFASLVPVIEAAMQIIQAVIQIVTAAISGDWGAVWQGILSLVSGVWNLIVSVVSGFLANLGSVIAAALSIIGTVWNALWSNVGSFFAGVWNGIVSGLQSMGATFLGWFTSLPGLILGAISGIGSWLVSAGSDLINGFIQGVTSMASALLDAVLAPFRGLVGAVKALLGIRSPSRVFRQIGEFTGEGMAIGLERSAGRVADASKALIPTTPSFRSPEITGPAYAGIATSAAAPLVGSLTLTSSGDLSKDLDEVAYRLRTIQRGNR